MIRIGAFLVGLFFAGWLVVSAVMGAFALVSEPPAKTAEKVKNASRVAGDAAKTRRKADVCRKFDAISAPTASRASATRRSASFRCCA